VLAQFRNNAFQTSAVVSDTITLDTRPDLVVDSVSNPPATAERGDSFSLTDTTRNLGPTGAGASKTIYYLSENGVLDAGDRKLEGKRNVPALGNGAADTGARTVTVSNKQKAGVFRVLACTDGPDVVDEFNENNQCDASAGTVEILVPDLRVTSISDPPASQADGTSFSVTDTTRNIGSLAAGASKTRYFLSLDDEFGGGDIQLNGNRDVPGLAPGASDTGTRSVGIPAGTPADTYELIACADAATDVKEDNEDNNCRDAATTIAVT
jgi:subtilase family serine protease